MLAGASLAIGLATAISNSAGNQTPISKPLLAGTDVPSPVRSILQRKCQDCHSANTTWPWYANIPPFSWQIHRDVARGRAFMDLSKWNDYTDAERQGFMVSIRTAIQNHLMPPSKYLWVHPGARLSAYDAQLISDWTLNSVITRQLPAHRAEAGEGARNP
jgi:hypothetical protein